MSDDRAAPARAADGMLTVHVVGLPVDVQSLAQQQNDELTREFVLMGEQMRAEGNTGHLPGRLVALIEQLTHQYSAFTAEQEQQLGDAVAAGVETLDLVYQVPVHAAVAAQALSDILDECDDYCRAGQHLLTLATPELLVTYRRWFLSQFTDQAAGRPPVSWADHRRHRGS